ncbi:transposase [Amycolatopsis sp. NPDC059090]|uniref:IS110 family transposase n=1 Tax=unclassified Amycolatopsis TaxID=2618356 RepID=UPI0036716043
MVSLLTVMLLDAGIRLAHVPGLVVTRVRRAAKGGEAKSDPHDAKTIADQLRLRGDWNEITTSDETALDLCVLVFSRQEILVDQTRRPARLCGTLAGFFTGLERAVDVTVLIDPRLPSSCVTSAKIRRAGQRSLTEYLLYAGVRRGYAEALADKATTAARSQRTVAPG